MAKRWRVRNYRPGELSVYWGIADSGERPDVIFSGGVGVPRCDRALMHCVFGTQREILGKFNPSLLDELQSRGYDITTLKFSIQKLPEVTP